MPRQNRWQPIREMGRIRIRFHKYDTTDGNAFPGMKTAEIVVLGDQNTPLIACVSRVRCIRQTLKQGMLVDRDNIMPRGPKHRGLPAGQVLIQIKAHRPAAAPSGSNHFSGGVEKCRPDMVPCDSRVIVNDLFDRPTVREHM